VKRQIGVPQQLRTLALILVLLALHTFVPGLVESLRLLLLRGTATPLQWSGRSGSSALAAFTAREPGWLAGAQKQFRRQARQREDAVCLLPVLDLNVDRGRLVLGGGLNVGVRRNALVFRGNVCVGVVDRVEAHLSRVRLLHSRRTSLPVRVADPGRELPGGLAALHGVLTGDGEGAFLASTFLPEAFKPGDELVTLGSVGLSPREVGTVRTSGVRPLVTLAAIPDGISILQVQGARRSVETAALFKNEPFDLLFCSSGRDPGAVVCGPSANRLLPGSAVHHGEWFLGVVQTVGPGAAGVIPASHPGLLLTARVIGLKGRSHGVILEGLGGGRVRVQRWLDKRPAEGPVLVATAGGQQLVPPWLVIGRGTLGQEELELQVSDRWPQQVEIAVFRHGAERRRLVGGKR